MRLAISNIAWDVAEDEVVAARLAHYGIDAIDIAPGKYFPDPANATKADITRVRNWWGRHRVDITGMQALLFGTSGLNVFGGVETRHAMLGHLAAVCQIGEGLGATRLVFGSPKNRDRSGVSSEEAMDIAVQFFRQLGDIAESHGVSICLEPNPPCYGANFMTTSAETAMVVRAVSHPAIKMQLDTGAMTINCENAAVVLEAHADLVGHVHASEPGLLPLGDGATDHNKVYEALQRYLPQHVVSIEMLATQAEPHVASIERALKAATLNYRPNGVRA